MRNLSYLLAGTALGLFLSGQSSCNEDSDGDGWTVEDGDCDDTNAEVHPGAEEVCNGLDDDCDEGVDEDVTSTFYTDADGDGYGDSSSGVDGCEAGEGQVSTAGDCDDADAATSPGATESANGSDDDCDGDVDEGVYFSSCEAILATYPDSSSGAYTIAAGEVEGGDAFEVYCDMETAGGGWTMVARISANDANDQWGYDGEVYRSGDPFGDATSLSAADAKSAAYGALAGTAILIRDLNENAYAAHTYSDSAMTWEQFISTHWNDCGYQISGSAIALADDGRDSVIGNALYFRHYDAYFTDCSAQERAMFSEVQSNAGWIEVGIGITEGNATYRDAQSGPSGSSSYGYNVSTEQEDYALFVR